MIIVEQENEHIWTTQNGDEIKVKDMTSQHILNCIKCIEEGRINFIINMGWAEENDYQEFDEDTERKEQWIKIFNNELKRRKENGKTNSM
ncbi:MAG: hypothetical protein ACLU84_06835 [Clostridia bacterium]